RRVSAPVGAWRPLRGKTFRDLLIANVFSDVGAFMQSVGAAWLMVSLKAGPMYVALTQTASALPFFLFALPAGALGDIVDRRKLILCTEIWMAFMAVVLATLVIMGLISPWLLLALTLPYQLETHLNHRPGARSCPNWSRKRTLKPRPR